jgi:hypothetical protein
MIENEKTGEVVWLNQELVKVNVAFVVFSSEHREKSTALQQRVKTLEVDLATVSSVIIESRSRVP